MIPLMWLGCPTPTPIGTTPPEPLPPVETAAPLPGPLAVDCGVQLFNQLRIECGVTLEAPSALEIRLEVEGEAVRVHTVDEVADTHRLVFWDFLEGTRVTWQISAHDGTMSVSGEVWMGGNPAGGSVDLVDVVAGDSLADRLFFPWSCSGHGYLLVTDGLGRVRWYEAFHDAFGVKGIEVSDAGTFLAITNRTTLTEIAPHGETLLELSREAGDFALPIHHDVASQNGQRAVLTAEGLAYPDGETYIVDGAFWLDPTVVDQWSLSSVLDPQGLPQPLGGYWAGEFLGIDFGHANSIDIDDQGRLLISFKHLDTVALFGLDGEVVWSLTGRGPPALPNPLRLNSQAGLDFTFDFQHHADWIDETHITLFDNGASFMGDSRVITVEIDVDAGTADVVSSFDLLATCPIQSSGFLAPDGTLIASCAATRHLYEFDADGTLRREVALMCPESDPLVSGTLVRVVPMSFDTIGRFARL